MTSDASYPGPADELSTVCDFMRYAVSRFNQAGLAYGHGTENAFDEAAFLLMETLHLPPDTPLDPYWNARLTAAERGAVAAVIEARAVTRKPAPYLVNRAYIQGIPFYVDERVIVPRSFIGDLLFTEDGFTRAGDPAGVSSVLDLCTGSGCIAVLAAHVFPNARIDAVDLSPDALAVAQRNVADSGHADRISLYGGDLFAPLAGKKYDLILTNPPYVDAGGMAALPPEYRHEPEMALGSGEDGLDIVRRILKDAAAYLNPNGGLLCEVGRGRDNLERDYPKLPFLWLDTENSDGEVFWLTRKQLAA